MIESKLKFFSLTMLAFLMACIVSINIPVLQEIIGPWHEDGTYSHGYLLLGIAGYMFWRNRKFLSYPATKTNSIAIITFVGLCAVWLAARIMGIEVVYRALIPFFLLNLFYFVLTPKAASKFVFPCLILLFAIPFWGLLSGLLQIVSAQMVTTIVQSMGLNVFLNDIYITIPAGTFEVAGGCSGIRYLLVTLTLSSIYSHFYYNKASSIIKLTLLSIVLSLVTNWIRIVILVFVGHYTDMQHEMLDDHNNLGWIVFFILMIPMRIYAQKLETNEEADADRNVSSKLSYTKRSLTKNAITTASACVIAVSLMGSILLQSSQMESGEDEVKMIAINDSWTETKYQTNFNPFYVEASGGSIVYSSNKKKESLQLSIYRYKNTIGDADLTDYRNMPIPEGWYAINSKKESISTELGEISVITSEVTNDQVNIVSIRVNQIGSMFSVSGLKSKIFKLFAWVKGEQYSGAIIVSMKCPRSCNKQVKTVKLFIKNNVMPITSFISNNQE